jgi:cytochrome c oxidase subunit 3
MSTRAEPWPEHPPHLAHHFRTPREQFEAGKLGMWVFLLTEILFFGGLFCAYAVYRSIHPEIFIYAHQFLDKNLGAINTVVLLASSLTMAWAVRCAQLSQRRGLVLCLGLTLACAAVFLGVKAVEYRHKWQHGLKWAGEYDQSKVSEMLAALGEPPPGHTLPSTPPPARDVGLFFSIYFAMTGLHAVHVIAGMGVIGWLLLRAVRGHFSSDYFRPVDYVALYWHLVDIIWIYLFPLLYLIH